MSVTFDAVCAFVHLLGARSGSLRRRGGPLCWGTNLFFVPQGNVLQTPVHKTLVRKRQ